MGQWIVRIVKTVTEHTAPKYSTMNIDHYLWALLKEAEEQNLVVLREVEIPSERKKVVHIFVKDVEGRKLGPRREGETPDAVWERARRSEPIRTAEARWFDVPAVQLTKGKGKDLVSDGFVIDPQAMRFLIEFWGCQVFAASRPKIEGFEGVWRPFSEALRPLQT